MILIQFLRSDSRDSKVAEKQNSGFVLASLYFVLVHNEFGKSRDDLPILYGNNLPTQRLIKDDNSF